VKKGRTSDRGGPKGKKIKEKWLTSKCSNIISDRVKGGNQQSPKSSFTKREKTQELVPKKNTEK